MTLTVSVDEVIADSNNPLLHCHKSWDRIRLKQVAEIINGDSFSSEYFTNGEGKPLLRIRDIGDISTEKNFSGEYEDRYIVYAGDLVVGMDGDFVCDLWGGPEALLNQRVCKITPDEEVYNKKFLYYVLQPYLDAIHARTSATTVKHLSSNDIQEIPLPCPPINEQDRIVAKLEELFSKLSSGTDEIEAATNYLKWFRQSLLNNVLHGEYSQNYRKNNKSLEYKNQDIGSNGEDAIYPNYNNQPEIPCRWQWVSLKELFSFRNGDELPKKNRNSGDYSVYGGNGKTDSHDEWNIEERSLIVGRVGANCGNVHIAPPKSWVTDNAIYTNKVNVELSLRFIEYILDLYPLNSLSSGTGQPYISQKTLKGIDIPFPPISEQREIVNRLDSQMTIVDNISEILGKELKRSDRLHDSILKYAFEGKLVSQDSTENQLEESSRSRNEKVESEEQITLSEVISDVE